MQLTFVYYMLFLGPKDEYFDQISLSDVFLKYFDTDVVDNILFQTNLYANQRERNFAPLNREEFYGFLGINLIMGYHELPSWLIIGKLTKTLLCL